MADQQKWFKLWYSALSDDHLYDLTPAERWAWVALGAHTKVHGERGRVSVSPKNTALASAMGVSPDSLLATIKLFPHVHVEEGQNGNGHFIVTWQNWSKYQVDSTVAERVKALRSKRRGEESRGDKRRKEQKPPPPEPPPQISIAETNGHALKPVFSIPARIQDALTRSPRLGSTPKIRTAAFWQAQLRANPGVDFSGELLKAEAYLTSHPEKHYRRLEGFLHNWLARADRPPMEDEA